MEANIRRHTTCGNLSYFLYKLYFTQKVKMEMLVVSCYRMQTCYSPLHPYVLSISGYESIVRHFGLSNLECFTLKWTQRAINLFNNGKRYLRYLIKIFWAKRNQLNELNNWMETISWNQFKRMMNRLRDLISVELDFLNNFILNNFNQ